MALTDRDALCTLADLKADLGITSTSLDSTLERRILAASAMIEAYCGRRFRLATVTEALPGYGGAYLPLARQPVSSVAGVEFDGAAVDVDSYSLATDADGNGWAVYSETGWALTSRGVQGLGEEVTPVVGTEAALFSVTYTGGYCLPNDSTQVEPYLPPQLTEAALMLAAHLHAQRGRDANVVAESVGDASVQRGYVGGIDAAPGRSNMGIPGPIAGLIEPFRKVA